MNYHRRVLQFVTLITLSLFVLSFVIECFHIQWKPLQNISILSDVFKKKKIKNDSIAVAEPLITGGDSMQKRFVTFDQPNRLTAYYADSNNVVLKNFVHKLDELKKGKRKKLRIAFLGDSMIEDDFISLTLRKMLQQEFGGYGIGYMPMSSEFGGSRTTANLLSSTTWTESNFRKNPSKETLFISGRAFTTNGNAWTEVEDKTAAPSQVLNKYVLFGNTNGASIAFNNSSLTSKQDFNVALLDSAVGNKFKVTVNAGLPIYGVSLESPTGITVDNFSFRGNSGNEFAKFDSSFLSAIAKEHGYDLIIMQYGINLIEKASDEKFNWYYEPMKKSVAKIKTCFPEAAVLMIGCADRAFRNGSNYETAVGIPTIVALQQKIAYEAGVAFYNTYSSMGGEGSIVKWVEEKPSLAYKDYMHPNAQGSEVIGKSIYDAIIYEYKKITGKK
jgi:lysophospholipase L1-like esterase